jgi:predicted DNA-binding transcriptional regulator YafY
MATVSARCAKYTAGACRRPAIIEVMDRTERFYRIQQLLRQSRVVTVHTFLRDLEISLATFKRDLEYMRSRLNIPIVWDRELNGYRYDKAAAVQELPGLWFSDAEIYALLTMQRLLESLEPGLLGPHVAPLLERLKSAIGSGAHPASEVHKRIRILHLAKRALPPQHFQLAAAAVLQRRRLRMTYYSRARDEETRRDVSAQRLVHYRENWYLDAWCHLRTDIRSFAVDAIRDATLLDEPALELTDQELDAVLAAGYGIFSGRDVRWAMLRFSPQRARWVAAEQWHPQQRAHTEADGSYLLELPYSDSRELIMDILKHGAEVQVLAPPDLRHQVASVLRSAAAMYPS